MIFRKDSSKNDGIEHVVDWVDKLDMDGGRTKYYLPVINEFLF